MTVQTWKVKSLGIKKKKNQSGGPERLCAGSSEGKGEQLAESLQVKNRRTRVKEPTSSGVATSDVKGTKLHQDQSSVCSSAGNPLKLSPRIFLD